jgi:hypothetical protein
VSIAIAPTPPAEAPSATKGDRGINTASPTTTTAPTATASPTATAGTFATRADAGAPLQIPGIEALVSAIMNGSFKATYVTDPTQLQETTLGTDHMPNFYYEPDDTANQLASLLGGTVVQRAAFGQQQGWNEPLVNFIQPPSGPTFNAADVAYYSKCGSVGARQLTADLTQTINEGSSWGNYYLNGGPMPSFAPGYVGPPISGMTYPANMIGSDGNVINPAVRGPQT